MERVASAPVRPNLVNLTTSPLSDPMFVLLSWAAGVAVAAGVVTIRKVVGRGFTWLAAGTVAMISLGPALGGFHWSVWVALVATLVAAGAVMVSPITGGSFLCLAGGILTAAAIGISGPLLALSATIALGGITSEMLLGHWYLVDPTLDRLVLRVLAFVGGAGVAADALVLIVAHDVAPGAGLRFWVYGALIVLTIVLMAAVVGALRYPAYSGVMAATGLSYLAVLTALGGVFVGRIVAVGANAVT